MQHFSSLLNRIKTGSLATFSNDTVFHASKPIFQMMPCIKIDSTDIEGTWPIDKNSNDPSFRSGFMSLRFSLMALALGFFTMSAIAQSGSCPENTYVGIGNMVATCGTTESDGFVMGVFETSPLTSFSMGLQTPTIKHHPNWTVEQMGNIYFTELDNDGHIYAAASSFTMTQGDPVLTPNVQWRYGVLGGGINNLMAAGTVYRTNPVTGAPTVWAVLPQQSTSLTGYASSMTTTTRNTGPGLGGIAYDPICNQVAVANMEDGKIYLFDASAAGPLTVADTISTFDPLTADNGAAGMPAFGERVFGMDYYDGRYYYMIHDFNSGTMATARGRLIVRSVAVDACTIDASDDRLELDTVAVPSDFTSDFFYGLPVSADIDIDSSGRMAIGTFSTYRGGYYDFGGLGTNVGDLYNHNAGTYVFEMNAMGNWVRTKYTSVGPVPIPFGGFDIFRNATAVGGVAWNQFDGVDPAVDNVLWMSGGDFLADGQWGVIGYDVDSLDNIVDQQDTTFVIQFLYDNLVTSDPKGNGGDVDIFSCTSTGVDTFDLALRKTVSMISPGPYNPGGEVTFDIAVFNQGTVDADTIEITDYIPAGLILNDPNWTQAGMLAQREIYDLAAGESTSVSITFTISNSFTGTITNWAEISKGTNTLEEPDIDSTPDDQNFNTDGETNDLNDDNVIDEDGMNGGDEDDHDPAEILVTCPAGDCVPRPINTTKN